jgi:protoporphyrinogen oxidase
VSAAQTMILGGGVTGLATGMASGLPVYEAEEIPGGICASYYVRAGDTQRLAAPPTGEDAYHFEIGGGHWIFGGDPAIVRLINDLAPCKSSQRISSVYFHEHGLSVPYPLQNNLRHVDRETAERALAEMATPHDGVTTLKEWLYTSFGPTLAALFFDPFHDLYTAGLYDRIAPQDAYKSPVDIRLARQGATGTAPPVGYNVTFLYPKEGLDALARRMAARADVHYGKRAVAIDVEAHEVRFADGSVVPYRRLISTLPLNLTLALSGLSVEAPADPFTSVLVLNLGAVRGAKCPPDHWLYNCRTRAGFHRVGFYSNVDPSFLPRRGQSDRVSIYVERAFPGGQRPTPAEEAAYAHAVVTELQDWDFIGSPEVVDPTWIDVAYTWAWPGSRWRAQALAHLEARDVYPVGRYGRWIFQGIADSIRDGLFVGGALKETTST